MNNEMAFFVSCVPLMFKIIQTAIFCVLAIIANAQQYRVRVDSLTNVLNNPQIVGISRIETLIALASIVSDSDYHQSKIIAQQAIQECINEHQRSLQAKVYYEIALIDDKASNLDSAIHYYNLAIAYYNPQTEKKAIAKALNQKGIVFESKGQYAKSYEAYISSLRLYDELDDDQGICSEYLNIGLIHHYRKEFLRADRYFMQALVLARKHGYINEEASALNNLGMNSKEQKKYKAAYMYFKQVLDIDMKGGDEANIAYSLNNMGTINADMGRYAEALDYYNRSAHLKEKLKDHIGLANTFNNIGFLFYKLNRPREAEAKMLEAKALCLKYGFQNVLVETYRILYELKYAGKDYKEALHYFQSYESIKDSLITSESNLAIHDLENQYKLDKVNDALSLKEAEISNAALLRGLFLVVIVMLLGVSLYFFYNVRRTRKLFKALNEKHEDLVQAKLHVEKATNAKTQFLSIMSHEMRTPLNAIIGIANLLEQEKLPDSQLENIAVMKSSSQNLLHLINELLDLSKLEAGRTKMASEPLSLHRMSETVRSMFAVLASQKGLNYTVEYDTRIPDLVVGDELKLTQSITNLVGNAMRFTEKGTINMRIQLIELSDQVATIYFEVTDTGIGIPKELQQTIFESFSQASIEINKKYGGTGLGLSISKKLVALMGGELQVQSQVGEGSTFSFKLSLPVHRGAVAKSIAEPINTDKIFAGKAVLVADDNAVNVFVLKQFLQKWGATIGVAENGEEALKMLEEQPYDIVLMDIQMPVKDGIEATREIRASAKPWRNIPIIALTASHEDEISEKIKAIGMNSHIIKPFMPNDLMDKLTELL